MCTNRRYNSPPPPRRDRRSSGYRQWTRWLCGRDQSRPTRSEHSLRREGRDLRGNLSERRLYPVEVAAQQLVRLRNRQERKHAEERNRMLVVVIQLARRWSAHYLYLLVL